jgi:spermidine synthase
MSTSTYPPLTASAEAASAVDRIWPFILLFFVSGFPALLYQIVWQRALFTIYGVNIESVTVIVTVFMLGLGLGSLAGGRLSTLPHVPVLRAFGAIECSVGLFGFGSLHLFHWIAQFTAGRSTAVTGFVTFLLLLVPTMLMGSTLPLLTEHLVRRTSNVGHSVGALYAVNTLGSGIACLAAAAFLMRALGECGSIDVAMGCNLTVGVAALFFSSRAAKPQDAAADQPRPQSRALKPALSFPSAMILAGATGFVALAFEILWYRIYSYVSGNSASSFAVMLGFYLVGIACGAWLVYRACKGRLASEPARALRGAAFVVLAGTIVGYLLAPAVSFMVRYGNYARSFCLVELSAALLGAAFPLLAHAAIGAEEQAGTKISYLYLSNIIGSALGSFFIGFVVLDHWSTAATSVLLLGLGLVISVVLALFGAPRPRPLFFAGATGACLLLACCSGPLFSHLYERLLFKNLPHGSDRVTEIVENRSGIIAVDSSETVFGNGVYDGHFNIDPVHDDNGIFRAYAIPALHPNPQSMLIVGLSSGSWAQIAANNPAVHDVTIVEINPGYSPLIRQRPGVASLLTNPKVHIVIDDGRRWLVAHPQRKFDFILMNTTYNWRANASNLLSEDFLRLIREHLDPGGVLYYNTPSSTRVQLTGAIVFPYALRISNFLAVSDSPLFFDRTRLRAALLAWRIDDRPVFDVSRRADQAALDRIVSLPVANAEKTGQLLDQSIEVRSSLLARLRGLEPVTDDNMGTEWQ